MLTAKNRDQLRNPTLGNRVWATFTFTFSPYLRRLLLFYRNDYKVFGFRVPDIIRRRLGEE